MGDLGPQWRLEGFSEGLDIWADQERPTIDVRLIAASWVLSRFDGPYQGMHRAAGFPNLWFGAIPGTSDGVTTAACSYWIEEQRRVVRCDLFSTLSLPI